MATDITDTQMKIIEVYPTNRPHNGQRCMRPTENEFGHRCMTEITTGTPPVLSQEESHDIET
jgi:hypothetical protein